MYEFARAFVPEYRKFLLSLRTIKEKKRNSAGGTLNIYANMLFQRTLLNPVMEAFTQEYPNVRVNIFETDSVNIFEDFALSSGEKEMKAGFCQRSANSDALWQTPPGYEFTRIFKGPYYAGVHPDLDFGQKEAIRKLLRLPIVLYASHKNSLHANGKSLSNPLLCLLKKWAEPRIDFSANTMERWRATILAHRCVGFIHSFLVRHGDPAINGIRLVEIKENTETELGCLLPMPKNGIIHALEQKVDAYLQTFGMGSSMEK